MPSIEKTLEKRLKAITEKVGGVCLKLPSIFVAGLPDRLLLLPGGRVIFVEVKDANKTPKKIQNWWHKKLRGLGFRVYVLDSIDILKQITDEIQAA